jgi:hypothetical protein
MWKNAFSAAAAAACLVGPAFAAESSRLSAPHLQVGAEAASAESVAPATLRPAKIGAVEPTIGSAASTKSTSARTSSSPQRPTQGKTSNSKQAASRKPAEKKPQASSRRTAAPAETEHSDQRITFHPVEVLPLKEDSRRVARSQPAPVGEVQYPVIPSDSLASESTAEYEEDDGSGLSTESQETGSQETGPQENFAPIVSAADMPRPGAVRPTAADEARTPPDLSLPPIVQQPAAEMRQEKKPPRTLSSVLRLPEFRARPARKASE